MDDRLSKSIKRGMVNDQTYSSTYIGFVKDPIRIELSVQTSGGHQLTFFVLSCFLHEIMRSFVCFVSGINRGRLLLFDAVSMVKLSRVIYQSC